MLITKDKNDTNALSIMKQEVCHAGTGRTTGNSYYQFPRHEEGGKGDAWLVCYHQGCIEEIHNNDEALSFPINE